MVGSIPAFPVLGRKAEIGVEAKPDVMSVKRVNGVAALEQLLFDADGER